MTFLLLFAATLGAQAQFKQDTKYVGASLTGLGLSYSSAEKFRFGVDAEAGYFIADGLMLKANVGYEHTRAIDDFHAGLGGRYYFLQNGIFIGAGAEYAHYTPSNNDVRIPVEIGYCYYLNHYIAIEPSVYYKMSLDNFSDKSTVGFKVGLGIFF